MDNSGVEGAYTAFNGLWETKQNTYCSKVFKKSDIPKYAKMILLKNKYHKDGDRKPEFVFSFASGDVARAMSMDIRNEYNPLHYEYDKMKSQKLFTEEEVQRIINLVVDDVLNGYTDLLVDDYI